MHWRSISRRRLLRQATLASATGALVGMAPSPVLRAAEPTRAPSPRKDGLSVLEFGAAGDGRQDDTPTFEAALKSAAQSGGNVVRIPRGNYLIRGKVQMVLEPEVDAALIFGNRLRGKERILNQAGDRAQIGMNVVSG